MVNYIPNNIFVFVVDTDTYAGNFERELTAFCTGQTGDCGVGDVVAKAFLQEFPTEARAFYMILATLPDERGTERPASIYPTPGYFNDGRGGHWPDRDWCSQKVIDKYREAVRESQARGGSKDVDAYTALPSRHPAYLSAATFFAKRPTDEQIAFFCKRAQIFANKESFRITAFRLLQVETKKIEHTIWESGA